MRITQINTEKGFTLVEMVFVIAIFAVMAAIVLFNFKGFGTSTSLDNLAQDIALRVVQAQKAAVSGALTPGLDGLTDATAPSYGVHFESGATPDTADQQFTYFADQNHDGFFNNIGSCPLSPILGNECLSVTSITTGDYVSDICIQQTIAGTSSINCSDSDPSLDITFTRPYSDATLKACSSANVSGCGSSAISAGTAYIEITSSLEPTLKQTIVVTSLGEVSVESGDACTVAGATSCPSF